MRTVTWVAAIGLVAVAAAGSVTAMARRVDSPSTSKPAMTLSTARVTRTDLSSIRQVNGVLGYAGDGIIVNQATGVFTALPAPGTVISPGATIFEVDGRAEPLLVGDRPAWRELSEGVADGPDVRQLESNLVALGFTTGDDVVIDDHFSDATTRAVRRWQAAVGHPVTGHFGADEAVFTPGPIRIAGDDVVLGAPARPGTVVAHTTATAHRVVVQMPIAQQHLIAAGDTVSVQLPDGSHTPGHVESLSNVVQAADSTRGGSSDPATIEVIVTLDDPTAARGIDAAPVTIEITETSATNVLAVPVNALVAPANGGFAIESIDAAGARRLIPVRTGVFSQTLVEISGDGIADGDTVVVPAP